LVQVRPVQHSVEAAQAAPTDLQLLAMQTGNSPPEHTPSQQSAFE
jgi:hypothetical protein